MRVTLLVAMAQNLCSQLGNLGNLCLKVLPGIKHHETSECGSEKGAGGRSRHPVCAGRRRGGSPGSARRKVREHGYSLFFFFSDLPILAFPSTWHPLGAVEPRGEESQCPVTV